MSTAKITKIVRLHSSFYGNPAYRIRFDDKTEARTVTDAGWAYAIHHGMVGKQATYELDSKGRIKDLEVVI